MNVAIKVQHEGSWLLESVPHLDCININILVVIECYVLQDIIIERNWLEYMGLLCIISYYYMRIYNYLKKIFKV